MGMNDDDGMKIGVNQYKVEADKIGNITLYQYMERKDKTHYWYPIKYFGLLENALDYFADKEVIYDTGLKDFETVSKKQDEIYQLIRTIRSEDLVQLKVERVRIGRVKAKFKGVPLEIEEDITERDRAMT